MSSERSCSPDDRSVLLVRRRLEICERFEADFRSAKPARIEDYLAELSEPEQPALLRELLALEDELTRVHGQRLDVSEYVKRFPEHTSLVRAVLETSPYFGATDAAATTQTAPRTPPALPDSPGAPASPFSSYEILGELGRGGMGIVYRAFDHRLGQIVALKTLKHRDPGLVYRFKREFRTVADISHPNLATLHELVSDGRDSYLAMELVDGVNFLEFIRYGPKASSGRRTDGRRVHELPKTTTMIGAVPRR